MAIWLFVIVGMTMLTACGVITEAAAPQNIPGETRRYTLAIAMAFVAREVEVEAFRCIGTALREDLPDIRIIPPDDFRHLALPDLPPEAAIYDPEYLALALSHHRFRQRIESLGIRYLIALRGVTEQRLVGAGAGGVAGLIVWNRSTRLAASILDVAKSQEPNELEATASGNPWLLLLGGVPLVIPAATEFTACQALGKAVVKFLREASKAVR